MADFTFSKGQRARMGYVILRDILAIDIARLSGVSYELVIKHEEIKGYRGSTLERLKATHDYVTDGGVLHYADSCDD